MFYTIRHDPATASRTRSILLALRLSTARGALMVMNRSAPPGAVVPWLIYDDVAAAIPWLCEAFGFTERLRTAPEPDGTIHHAQLAVGSGSVVLTGRPAAERSASPLGTQASPQPPCAFVESVYVQVDDVDRHCERAQRFGARILRAPRSCEFGERQYSTEDLAGHHWTFSQSIADVSPETWGARVSNMPSP
jgi:uncharacterized glyoxalase superfamily protein PhnB